MDDEMKEKFLQQHIGSYRSAMKDIVQNNTEVLMEDILSFIGKPPLDSMDFIQNKFLDLAKKEKLVFKTENLKNLLNSYRNEMVKCCDKIKSIRISMLIEKIEQFDFQKDEMFCFYKKDFGFLNKKIRNILKEQLAYSFEEFLLPNITSVFSEQVDEEMQKKIIQEITKYMKGNYQKQILENFDMKVLVKDTTLMNSIKEQGDRYLFTLKNSRVFSVE